MVLGSINGINGATANVNVGIGTTAPAYRLQLGSGDAAKPGISTWVIASDRRLKQDISSFTDGLEVLKQVKPVWFRYNGEAGLPQDKKYVGVIAQEMQQVAPYTIGQFTYQDTTGKTTQYLDYDANALTYILVNSVQEQQKQLQEKDAQIGELKGLLSALEQKMNNELAALKALLLKQPTVANAEGDAAQLWQNEPNPTDGTTVIRYHIPKLAVQAQLKIFSTTGQELYFFDLSERGEGSLTVPASLLPSGVYVYRLMVDGNNIAARKMVLAK